MTTGSRGRRALRRQVDKLSMPRARLLRWSTPVRTEKDRTVMGHASGAHRGGQAPDQTRAPTGPGPATTSGQVGSKAHSQSEYGVTLEITNPQPSSVTGLRGGSSQADSAWTRILVYDDTPVV
jgi:hypothetical protein